MPWIDSHCHLDDPSFKHDLASVLTKAEKKGIKQFIVPGTSFQQWEKQQELENQYPNISNAYGIHPWFCDLHNESHLEQLDKLLNHAIAVGECGLDLMPNKPDLEKQLWWFDAQLALAKKHNLPLIIHSVKASDLIVKYLKKEPELRGVIHGFSGSVQQAKAFTKLGFHIGIGTRLLREGNAKAEALISSLPLKNIVLETDAPHGLGQNTRNEPSGIILVANIIAKIQQQDTLNVLLTCTQNARELF